MHFLTEVLYGSAIHNCASFGCIFFFFDNGNEASPHGVTVKHTCPACIMKRRVGFDRIRNHGTSCDFPDTLVPVNPENRHRHWNNVVWSGFARRF